MVDRSDINAVDDAAWEQAVAREAVIRRLACEASPNRAEFLKACRDLGLKRSRLYELISAYKARPVASSLLAAQVGTPTGSRRLPDEIEAVISGAIEEFYKSLQKPSINALQKEVRKRCRQRGLRPPCWTTLRDRVAAIDPAELMAAREGAKASRQRHHPVSGCYQVERTYEVVQIDHTLVDVIVVDRVHRKPLQRPWLTLAAHYGSETLELMVYLAGQGGRDAGARQVDDVAPDMGLLRLWAKACRIDPERLRRRSLASRNPHRPRDWFLTETVPVCLACFDADVAAGRDAYLRVHWRLAERVVCLAHRTMLLDRCHACLGRLKLSFHMLNGLLRPFCRKCDAVLTGGGGEAEDLLKVDFAAGVLDLQRQINGIVRGGPGRLDRLEYAIRTLWAPLDRDGAARPVLALWYDIPGWNCPFEARTAVGRSAPLQHLSVRWRALTLVILHDLFGADLVPGVVLPEAALVLFQRAAPLPWLSEGRGTRGGKGKRGIDVGAERVHSLSKRPVHRLNGNFLDERGDFGRIHP